MNIPSAVIQSLEASSIKNLSLANDLWAVVEFSNDEAVVIPLDLLKRLAIDAGLSAASNVRLLIAPDIVQ